MGLRVGHGFDVHAFGPGDAVVLGGVRIPHDRGLRAHSDGDVVIHALCDALLGAAALGDIGVHFPDTDERLAGADSRELLRRVITLLAGQGCTPVNADLTIIAQAPRIAPHAAAMRDHIAADTGLVTGAVNVKASTTEGLGFTGRGEGIAAFAVVLVERDT